MIDQLDHETKKRVDKAIANIRLIATRVKRPLIEDAAQRREIVVTFLNEFRQYIANESKTVEEGRRDYPNGYFKGFVERSVQATFQADSIFSFLTRERKKTYEQEYRQVWNLLENTHAYLVNMLEKGSNNG